MKCLPRMITTLTVIGLLTPAFTPLGHAQIKVDQKTYTISGSVGIPGVVMNGLPGQHVPVSDENGVYSAGVQYGWSGAVTPTKPGYAFDPPSREYAKVEQNCLSQDYAPLRLRFTVSGQVWTHTPSGPVGVEGVTLEGLPGETVTDEKGRYEVAVDYGWTGRVTPRKESCHFEPAFRDCAKVTADPREQNFIAMTELIVMPHSTSEVMVIPTTGVALEKFAQTAEDMRVMLDILREKLNESRTIPGALYDYGDFFRGTGRTVEALYVQGYGAIFMMRVDFPFSLSAPQDQAEAPPQEAVDPVWQRARQKLYQPADPRTRAGGQPGGPGEMDFNQFKDDLLRTLRHASNIRNIDPNEWVILTVIGQSGDRPRGGFYDAGMMGGMGGFAGGGGVGGYGGGIGGMGGYGGMGGGMGAMVGGSVSGGGPYGGAYAGSGSYSSTSLGQARALRGQAPVPGATVLTLQAKKADIDAFAKGSNLTYEQRYGGQPENRGQVRAAGTLTFEQFQQRVKVFTY